MSNWTVDYDPTIQTDITVGTKARTFWRFYEETRQQISDLEEKRDLYAKQYLKEMRNANIKTELSETFLEWIPNTIPEDAEEKKKRDAYVKMLIDLLFTAGFRKSHKIEYAGKEQCGLEKYAHRLNFYIGAYEYILECPHPRNMPLKYFQGQDASEWNLMYRALCIPNVKMNDSVRELTSLCSPTYDWKECASAIEQHVLNAENGGNIELC